MFHKEFYPTQESTLLKMGIDCSNKICYEPHAGKGDIVDYLLKNGAKEVIASEINEDLRHVVSQKCRLIGTDFLDVSAEDISHVQLIVMNPPFSNADEHILHAFEIAPEGCDIIALCNWETLNNTYERTRRQLRAKIDGYGIKSNMGPEFDTAERKTGIDIGMVKLFKPALGGNNSFEGFFMEDDEIEAQGEGILPFNEVRALVQRYVGAMKIFDDLQDCMESLKYTTSALGMTDFTLSVGHNDTVTTKEQFGKALQKKSWVHIINKMGIRKYVTSGMLADINKFVETQTQVRFTERNVYHMIDMIVQTRGENFDKALLKAVDRFTEYTHENRFSHPGWKTNDSHMLNKKFIVDYMAERSGEGMVEIGGYSQRSRAEYLDDLTKSLCYLKGDMYNDSKSFSYMKNLTKEVEDRSGVKSPSRYFKTNTWYDFHDFFEFKVYLKGTMHLRFKNVEDWYILNQRYGKLQGFNLPENMKK